MKKRARLIVIISIFCMISTSMGWYGSEASDESKIRKEDDHSREARAYSTRAENGLVAQWHMDDDTGDHVIDGTGNGHLGLLNVGGGDNVNSKWVDGISGRGIEFDGDNDHIEITDNADLHFPTSFSIEVWVYPHAWAGAGQDRIIVSHQQEEGCGYILGSLRSSEKLTFGYYTGSTWDSIIRVECPHPEPNRWCHIAAIYERADAETTIRLYLNGKEGNSTVSAGEIEWATGNLFIGANLHHAAEAREFDGKIDEVSLYDRTLTTNEIAAHYDSIMSPHVEQDEFGGSWFDDFNDETGIYSGLGRLEADEHTVGLWHFDEGTGNEARDASGNGNNGTLQNMEEEDWVNGRFRGGLYLNPSGGNEWVNIPNNMNSLSNGTIEFWMMSFDNINGYVVMFNGGESSGKFWINRNGPEKRMQFSLDSGGPNNPLFTPDGEIKLKQWYHMAFIWGSNGRKIFINGMEKANDGLTQYVDLTEGFKIGGGSINFNGIIDEAAIYNRSLTPYEIGQHYNRTLHPTNATITSIPITLPDSMNWTTLSISKTEPANTYINVSVINAEDNTTIRTFANRTNHTIDLSQLNDDQITSIHLKAYFSRNGSATPSLDSWGVEWTAENAWRDSFTGDSKVEYSYGVDEHTVGYWTFDEGVGDVARDSSGNGNDGTLTNMEEEDWVDGRIGEALRFDGQNDYISVSDSDDWNFDTEDFTVDVWVMFNSVSSYQQAFTYYPAGWALYFDFPNDNIRWNNGGGWVLNWNWNDPSVNTWYHIAIGRDTSVLKLYVNGVERASVSDSTNYPTSPSTLFIGQVGDNSYYFDGCLDEARIGKGVARTPDEIHQAYQAGISIHGGQVQLGDNEVVPEGNGSALWHFNEEEGDVVYDSSGNGNDGEIYGANWTKGVMGGALEFDGVDDYVQVPHSNPLDVTNEITLSAWIKPGASQVSTSGLPEKRNSYGLLYTNTNKIYFRLYNATGFQDLISQDLNTGRWYHITGTFDGTNQILYINGIQIDSEPYDTIKSTTNRVDIGLSQWGCYFNGAIDEVAIYNRALNASEIRAHANHYHYNATLRSVPITLPYNQTWDTFHCNRTVPDNTYLNITIHDGETNETLWTEYNRTGNPYVDLSGIDPLNHPSIYLNATFQSNRTETPILRDWAVNWTTGIIEPQPPQWFREIENISFEEDSSYVLDPGDYFRDVNYPPSALSYDICHAGGAMEINGTINNSSITFETNLANWSGNATFYIVCLNEHGPSRSNNFTVFVTPVDDRPMWKHPISDILLEEDISARINLIDLVEDAEDDPYNFSSSVNDSNIEVNISQGVMKIIPADNWYGEANVELLVYQASNSSLNSSAFFTVKVTSENDLPITTLISPSNGSMWAENEITLRWSCYDPDGPLQNIQYEVYLSTDLDVVLNRNKTGMSIPSMYATENANITLELPDGTYYWSVIGFDGIGYGSCAVEYYIFNINTNLTVPEVILLEPLDDTIISKKYAILRWKLNTTTEREIVYRVYFGTDKDDLTEKTTTSNASFNVTGLEDGNTYYWKVIPHNGSIEGICKSGTWHFTVNTSFVPVYSITAELDSSRLDIVRGGSGMFNVTLTNNGNVPVTVTLFPEGALAGSVDIRENVIVPVGGSRKVPVWINDTSSIKAGSYQLVINISHNGKDMSLSLPVTITEQVSVIGEGEEPGLSGAAFALIIAGVVIVLILIIVFFILRKKRKKPEASPELEGDIKEEFEEGIGEDYEKDMKTLDEEETLKDFMAEPSDEEMEGVEDMVKELEEFESPIPGISPPAGMVEPGLPPAPAVAVPEPLHLSPPPEVPLPALPEAPPEPVPPSTANLIPGYILTHKIGSGGFAVVYKGIDPQGKTVAIKLPKILDETVSTSVLEQFKAEADIWKKLKHKNIVKFHNGDVRPIPFLVVEYMEGGNLLDMLKGDPIPVDLAISLIQEILSGVGYAHRMASVHRDIKPENILFTKDGVPKISDWGIGKFMASESATESMGIKGTLAYSSPEQISKDTYGEVDWSTDVFQLATVFYEMLTGENPFYDKDPVVIMSNLINKIPLPPSSLRRGIPPEIDSVILRALEKEKKKRFSSAEGMYEKFREALKDRERNVSKYKNMLNRALKDGIISTEEEEMLEGMREHFGISFEQHEKMIRELMP